MGTVETTRSLVLAAIAPKAAQDPERYAHRHTAALPPGPKQPKMLREPLWHEALGPSPKQVRTPDESPRLSQPHNRHPQRPNDTCT